MPSKIDMRRFVSIGVAFASGALIFAGSNISCNAVPAVCAQSTCADTEMLSIRLAELETKVQELSGRSGTYSDERAVAAVAAANSYVTRTGDSTISGKLTVTGDVKFGTAGFKLWRATFYRGETVEANRITFKGSDGTTNILDISDSSKPFTTSILAYRPGDASNDAALYINISGSSGACTLLHAEDDEPVTGYYFATDSGNGQQAIWGNTTTPTFILKRTGQPGIVLPQNAQFDIVCL